mmetsp:Transcript_62563/g.123624  ORF Transcript_62563/g.123624 Transcript_62563/m.123624 type:complete len:149 (+) Transcript_62563:478-924(+)
MWRASEKSHSCSNATLPGTTSATRRHLPVGSSVLRRGSCSPLLNSLDEGLKLLPTHRMACAGQKEQEAKNFLEKRYKAEPNPSLSYDDTVQLALACLQNVLGSDLKASDVEASVVRADALKFTKLTPDEIEAHLTALAERDDDVAARD